MPCFGHADGIASAYCSECAKPGCPACLEEIDDSFLCADCLANRLDSAELDAYTSAVVAEEDAARLDARTRIRRNWILSGLLFLIALPSLFGAVLEDPAIPSAIRPLLIPVGAIGVTYLGWAALWGIPAAWKWWKGILEGQAALIFATPLGWIVLVVTFFTIPVCLGYLYGVFGGAVYEYRGARRVAAGPPSDSP